MAPIPPSSVAKTSSYLGLVKINYKAWGFSYRCWLDTADRGTAITRLNATVLELRFLIPLQAQIFDSVVHMGDADIDGIPAQSGIIENRAVDIISPLAPGEDPIDDRGWEPDNQKSAIYTRIDTDSFSGKMFFRLPPDEYIKGTTWVGPNVADVVVSTAEPTFTSNPSVAATKVDGTYVERLRHFYWRLLNVHKFLWKPDPDNEASYLISPIKYVYFRRPTQFTMGRAFLPSQRR